MPKSPERVVTPRGARTPAGVFFTPVFLPLFLRTSPLAIKRPLMTPICYILSLLGATHPTLQA